MESKHYCNTSGETLRFNIGASEYLIPPFGNFLAWLTPYVAGLAATKKITEAPEAAGSPVLTTEPLSSPAGSAKPATKPRRKSRRKNSIP